MSYKRTNSQGTSIKSFQCA